MSDKKIITLAGNSEVIIKKSRFLGMAANVSTEEEAQQIIAATRKQHYSARHVCYAYSIGEENPRLKFSDDGEPGGTAGKPILDVVTGSGIYNIIIVVTRYFGGVLLGTGGLVRAYTQAAAEAVDACTCKKVMLSDIYDIGLEYGDYDKIRFILDSKEDISYETQYSDKVIINAVIPVELSEQIIQIITEKTAGKAVFRHIDTKVL